MLADPKKLFGFIFCLLAPAFPVTAQQSPSWQDSHSHQRTPFSSQRPDPSAVPQPSRPVETQSPGMSHPQVVEVPAAQPQSARSVRPPLSSPPSLTTQGTARSSRPAYFGATGKTALACRYPAGVRLSQIIENSPAHRAGLKGETTLTWTQAMTSVLAVSPVAPLVAPFFPSRDHGGLGDLILAVDGKRIHNREELEQEMARFRPGDVVYLSILREGSGLRQIPVQLADYPTAAPDVVRTNTFQPPPDS